MLNVTNTYAKVKSVDRKEKYTVVECSTSRKDKRTNEWIYSNWKFSSFVGHAHNSAQSLAEGQKIKITNGTVENVWNNEKKQAFLKLTVFDFEFADTQSIPATKTEFDGDFVSGAPELDDSCPF